MWGSPYKKPNCSVKGIYAINLDKSQDRWLHLQGLAKDKGISIQRCPAIDGRLLSDRESLELGVGVWGIRNITPKRKAEIGCFLSHRKLLFNLSKLPYDDTTAYLILEDDIYFETNFRKYLDEACMNVPENWDMFFLGYGEHKWSGNTPNPMIGHLGYAEGAYGYIVRAKFIPTLLPYLTIIAEPIDSLYCRLMKVFNIYGIKNRIIRHDYNQKSTIR